MCKFILCLCESPQVRRREEKIHKFSIFKISLSGFRMKKTKQEDESQKERKGKNPFRSFPLSGGSEVENIY